LVPNTQFIRERVATRGGGEIIVDEKCRTSVPTIFAAGDATTVPYKQIVVAMGEGAKAALAAYEQILLGTQQPAEPVAAAA
jgi:alkyl hydroperoxide reductase subunit F